MRVVIDTNVALSGLLWHSPPNQILKWARGNFVRILGCEETIAELSRAVRYKRFAKRLVSLELSPSDVIAYYMNLVLFVPSPKNIPGEIEEDPFDNVFLALAFEHRARLMVSGDRHILSLKEYGNIQIVPPNKACEVIEKLFRLE